jgi:hypothetical protein
MERVIERLSKRLKEKGAHHEVIGRAGGKQVHFRIDPFAFEVNAKNDALLKKILQKTVPDKINYRLIASKELITPLYRIILTKKT